jgi:hypothetical protein
MKLGLVIGWKPSLDLLLGFYFQVSGDVILQGLWIEYSLALKGEIHIDASFPAMLVHPCCTLPSAY